MEGWSKQARLRSDQIENGLDLTFSEIFVPYYMEKIKKNEPKAILEVGSGTGHLAKEIHERFSASLTVVEPSHGMFSESCRILHGLNLNIFNCTVDDLSSDQKYSLVLSHLVAHSVDELDVFFKSIRERIELEGSFVFSLPHPCFYNEYKKIIPSESYSYMSEKKEVISFNITSDPENTIKDVPYNHRSLSFYFNSLSKAGFRVENFEEIFPSIDIQEKYGSLWTNPRYCVFVCVPKS